MKCILKHIIACITLVSFLTATNGLSLVEHYCSNQNKSYVFWLTSEPDCEDHKCAEKPVEQTCCEHEHTTDCCQNINHFAKLDADYFSTFYDVKHTSCPVFYVEHLFDNENLCHSNCECHFNHDFSDEVGLLEQLLIKQITELLL